MPTKPPRRPTSSKARPLAHRTRPKVLATARRRLPVSLPAKRLAPARAVLSAPRHRSLVVPSRDPTPPRAARRADLSDPLPTQYGRTLLIVQARDPRWLQAYWEVTEADRAAARQALGPAARESRPLLRVYELREPRFDQAAIRRWFDVTLTPEAADWFIEVGQPSAWWAVELGWGAADGRFVSVARSNVVETPADHPADEVDEAWGLLGEPFAPYDRASRVAPYGSPQPWGGPTQTR